MVENCYLFNNLISSGLVYLVRKTLVDIKRSSYNTYSIRIGLTTDIRKYYSTKITIKDNDDADAVEVTEGLEHTSVSETESKTEIESEYDLDGCILPVYSIKRLHELKVEFGDLEPLKVKDEIERLFSLLKSVNSKGFVNDTNLSNYPLIDEIKEHLHIIDKDKNLSVSEIKDLYK